MISYNQLSRDIKRLKKNKKKIVFTISSTSKLGLNSSYLTPIRETKFLNILGVNIYTKKDTKKTINIVHKYIDYVFIDCEKKIKNTLSVKEIINYFNRKDNNKFKKSFFTYKANDLTVEAADKFLELKSINDSAYKKRIFGILGGGNIGSKLALKICERGEKVQIFRRNLNKLKKITEALNLIKNKYTKNKISFSTSILDTIKKSNILISCSNFNKPIITKKFINQNLNLEFILDIGKQSITEEGIVFANKNSIKIFRLDISSSLVAMIESYIRYDNLILKKIGRKKINGTFFVSGGSIAMKNDLIVDNINNIKYVYGLADGKGDFKKRFGNISLKRYFLIKKLKKNI